MISMDQAYRWLNVFSSSRLPPSDRNYLNVENEDSPEADFQQAVKDLLKASVDSGDAYRYAEAELFTGKAAFQRGLLTQAYEAVNRANMYYRGDGTENIRDSFRLAVSCWMLGLVEQQMTEEYRFKSHVEFRRALELFTAETKQVFIIRDDEALRSRHVFFFSNYLADLHRQEPDKVVERALRDKLIEEGNGKALISKITGGTHFTKFDQMELDELFDRLAVHDLSQWYPERIREMRIHLAQTIYEPYDWLNRALLENTTTQLPPFLIEFRDAIFAELRNGSSSLALEMCAELVRQTQRNPLSSIYAEARVIKGMAAFHAGDYLLSLDCFRRAAAAYPPDSHDWAVTFWMLGLAMQAEKTMISDSLIMWQRAIALFRDLKIRSDHHDKRGLTSWYQELIPILEQAYRERLSGKA
jgi:tetratricopeptide (TPR) repeat protein